MRTDQIALKIYQAMTMAAADPTCVTTAAATNIAETITRNLLGGHMKDMVPLAQARAEILGQPTPWKFHRPDTGNDYFERVDKNGQTVRFDIQSQRKTVAH